MFKSMGLDSDEVAAFFTVLSADDGAADYAEFITGHEKWAAESIAFPHQEGINSKGNIIDIYIYIVFYLIPIEYAIPY